MAADSARIGDLEVRAASVVGPGHRIDEAGAKPRQDAYRLGRDTASRHLIVAVADGMSDSRHSDTAAAVASLSLVNSLRRQLDRGVAPGQLDGEAAFLEAAGQVHATANQRGWPADDVRTVVAVAVIPTTADPGGDREVWVAGVGDVTVWAREPNRWLALLGLKEQGPDSGRLHSYLPHTPDAATHKVIRLGLDQVLALTTDGVGDVFVQLPQAHDWFHQQWVAPVTAHDLLMHMAYDAQQRNDDRTAAVVWFVPPEGRQ